MTPDTRVTWPKIFVVGCPRSGTTWALNMLRAHPLVIAPANETHVYDELYALIVELGVGPSARRRILAQYDRRPLGDAVGVHRLVARDDLVALLDGAHDSGQSPEEAAGDVTAALLDRFMIRAGATPDNVFVEKTPSHLYHSRAILQQRPEARIVEVVRDGRDVCVSMQYRAREVSWPPTERAEQVALWVDAVRFGMTVRASPEAAGRWHVFRFEAAKREPARAVAELFAFCGLPFDAALVDRVVQETDVSRVTDAGDGQLVRRGAIGDWRTHFTDDDRALFARLGGDALTAAGYDD